MTAGAEALDRAGGRVDGHGLLFEYTVKLLLVAAFLELVLFRLMSRLGMHASKMADPDTWQAEAVRYTFLTLAWTGPVLINIVSLLLFLALGLLVFERVQRGDRRVLFSSVTALVSLLMMLTIANVMFPSMMLSAVVYNAVAFVVMLLLAVTYLSRNSFRGDRTSSGSKGPVILRWLFIVCFFVGLSGWLYYQIVSTTYGMLGVLAVPENVHAVHRIGEFLVVLASVLTLFAYGGTGFFSKNKRQRRRVLMFLGLGSALFVALLFIDFFLGLYDKDVLYAIRKAGEGIGFIFQMGMGYTFYLPFALYLTGLLCWAYTVLKLVNTGRMAGYGIGLMFMGGYALQITHETLIVVLGMMLLNLDRRHAVASAAAFAVGVGPRAAVTETPSLVGEKT